MAFQHTLISPTMGEPSMVTTWCLGVISAVTSIGGFLPLPNWLSEKTIPLITMPHGMRATALPPSVEGNPAAYFFALFSLILVSSLASMKIMQHVAEANREVHLARRFPLYRAKEPASFMSALNLYRLKVVALYTTVFMGAIGDVLVLLLWREVSAPTMEAIIQLDRVLDGCTLFPFMTAIVVGGWSEQAIPQRLSITDTPVQPPKWARIKHSVRIVVVIAFIAAGVTAAKVFG